jgi:hypothetical protein
MFMSLAERTAFSALWILLAAANRGEGPQKDAKERDSVQMAGRQGRLQLAANRSMRPGTTWRDSDVHTVNGPHRAVVERFQWCGR